MGSTWSFRALPPEMRAEAIARSKIVRATLQKLRKELMPRADPMDIDVWERDYSDKIVSLIADAQAKNAALVDKTMNLELMANGWHDSPIGVLNPEGFAGYMPDGDPLEMIPRAVAKRVRERLALHEEPTEQQRRLAWEAGGKLLATITQTALIDTQRMAKSVAGLMRPKTLYIRMANVPCCARCAVLAGKRGYWDTPFQRHPGCDCTQIAVPDDFTEGYDGPQFDVQAYWDSLSAKDQDKVFTKSGAAAIRAGADISQVVNSKRGMSDAAQAFTRMGTTQRSKTMQYYYGQSKQAVKGKPRIARLSVPEIIKRTQGDQQRRVEMLYRYGYIRSVRPGVLPAEVRDAVADTARARHQALFEEFSEIVPKIDPALPVEHITKAGRVRFVEKKQLMYVSGGHTAECADEIAAAVKQIRAEHPNAELSAPKSFFPPQNQKQLLEWLANAKDEAQNDPDFLERTNNNGWLLQKRVVDPQGNRQFLEMIIQEQSSKERDSWRYATVFPRYGDNVRRITVEGELVDAPWKGD